MEGEDQMVQPLTTESTQLPETGQTPVQLTPEQAGLGIMPDMGAEEAGVEGAVSEETPQTGRIYTEAEFRKLQSALDRQVAEERQRAQSLEQVLQVQQMQAQQQQAQQAQAQDEAFLKYVQEQGGDVNQARGLVAHRQALRQQQMAVQGQAMALQQQQQQIGQMAMMADQAVKIKILDDIAKEHGVKPQDIANARTPQEAIFQAMKLKLARLEAGGNPTKFDSGMTGGRGLSAQSISKAYAEGRIDTVAYEQYMKRLGKQP